MFNDRIESSVRQLSRLAAMGVLLSAFGCGRPAPPKNTDQFPIESPFPIDYPLFEGSLKQLVLQKVGGFTLTESNSAFAVAPALESWSAFYKDGDGHIVQLRLHRCVTPTLAYEKLGGDRFGSPGMLKFQFEPATSKGKNAGAIGKSRYMNGVKGIEADVVWASRGNVAFIVSSPDGLHAETFWRELEKILEY